MLEASIICFLCVIRIKDLEVVMSYSVKHRKTYSKKNVFCILKEFK